MISNIAISKQIFETRRFVPLLFALAGSLPVVVAATAAVGVAVESARENSTLHSSSKDSSSPILLVTDMGGHEKTLAG